MGEKRRGFLLSLSPMGIEVNRDEEVAMIADSSLYCYDEKKKRKGFRK
jgi:hypothetical protein